MTGERDDPADPGELLQVLRPYGDHGYLAPGDDPHADALLQHLMSLDVGTRSSRSRTRRVVLLAVGLTVVGASATAAFVMSRPAANSTVMSCYSSADINAATQVVVVPDSSRTPVEQCAELWSDGRISSSGAPALVACVTPSDIVAVVPGDQSTCTLRGWAVLAVPTESTTNPTSDLTATLSDRFLDQCLDPGAAAIVVENALVDLGVTQWSVSDSTTNPDWCAVPAVDANTRTVHLVSHPR
jgi:hypothetical protein